MTCTQALPTAPTEGSGRQPCYRAYQPEAWERALMRLQNALVFQQPAETLAAYYSVWLHCRALGHSPVIVEKKTVLAAQARRLLQAGEGSDGRRPDEETRQFRRFCRLFLARGGEQFRPFYDLFAQFWAGQDIVQAPGQPARFINVLPQPARAGPAGARLGTGSPAAARQHCLHGLAPWFRRRSEHPGGNAGPRRELERERGQRPLGGPSPPRTLPA